MNKAQAAVVEATAPLLDICAALEKAVFSEKNRVHMMNANFKCNPSKADYVEQICRARGTTRSAFLRECLDGLIVAFSGPKALRALEGQQTE